MSAFDFDRWARLARDDPQQYFSERQQAIDAFIAAHPESAPGLRELQGRIDALRACAGGPLQAVRGMMGLLDDHLEALAGYLGQLREHADTLDKLADRDE